jgi:hypothetical protein
MKNRTTRTNFGRHQAQHQGQEEVAEVVGVGGVDLDRGEHDEDCGHLHVQQVVVGAVLRQVGVRCIGAGAFDEFAALLMDLPYAGIR